MFTKTNIKHVVSYGNAGMRVWRLKRALGKERLKRPVKFETSVTGKGFHDYTGGLQKCQFRNISIFF